MRGGFFFFNSLFFYDERARHINCVVVAIWWVADNWARHERQVLFVVNVIRRRCCLRTATTQLIDVGRSHYDVSSSVACDVRNA